MYEIHGALFFGAAQAFQDTINRLPGGPKVLIIRMRHVLFIDATGVFRLKEIISKFTSQGRRIILSGVSDHVLEDLIKGEVYSVMDKDNIVRTLEDAAKRSEEILEEMKAVLED